MPEKVEGGFSEVTSEHPYRIYRCSQEVKKRKNVPDKKPHKPRHVQNESEYEVFSEFWGDKKYLQHRYRMDETGGGKAVGGLWTLLHTTPKILDFIPSTFILQYNSHCPRVFI